MRKSLSSPLTRKLRTHTTPTPDDGSPRTSLCEKHSACECDELSAREVHDIAISSDMTVHESSRTEKI
jgi:hypothetical protein